VSPGEAVGTPHRVLGVGQLLLLVYNVSINYVKFGTDRKKY
jgi:hypothetical protein